MTMHEPSSGVVRRESNRKPSACWKHGNVSPGRIVPVQSTGRGISEATGAST